MKQNTNTKMLLVALFVAAMLLLFSCQNSSKLHRGWYSTEKLKNKGYNVPAYAPKIIYIRRTNDHAKANIIKP